jgi:hypothetical protein
MWLRSVRTGEVIDAGFYYSNGQQVVQGRGGVNVQDSSAPREPRFVARVDTSKFGFEVVPLIKTGKGLVWKGAPLSLK